MLLTTKGDRELWDFEFRAGDVLMMGRESAGVPESVALAADVRLIIPILAPLRSLNVAVAASIALAEAVSANPGACALKPECFAVISRQVLAAWR